MHNNSDNIIVEQKSALRGRGRPRLFDRPEALDKAMRLFWTKGYGATSIADLTEVMSIGSKSLYAAFGSKEALYSEALDRYLERYDQTVWGRFNSAPTARDAIEALLMDSAAFVSSASVNDDPRGCMILLSNTGAEGNVELGELIRSLRREFGERIEARLETAVASDELSPTTNAGVMSRLILAVLTGIAMQARDGVPPVALEETARVFMTSWELWQA